MPEDVLKFRMQGQERFTRAETLGEEYIAERIAEQIEIIQKVNRSKQRIAEISKPKVAETPKTQVPKIPETKPTEKKIDVWADIRGMRGADEMIADLESAGVITLDMLKSFFWKIKHPDDHSEELPPLQAEIKAIDTLVIFYVYIILLSRRYFYQLNAQNFVNHLLQNILVCLVYFQIS